VPFHFGNNFNTGPISITTSYYVESVRSDLFYKDQLETTLNSNINWNGAMFDIVAYESIAIDSFFVKINPLGPQ
jgi:hypothetical protein